MYLCYHIYFYELQVDGKFCIEVDLFLNPLLLICVASLPSPPLSPSAPDPDPVRFHGKILRDRAEELLIPSESPDGLFLVRESTNFPGDYTLCVVFQKKVEHYRVIARNNSLTIDEEEFFENLSKLVEVSLIGVTPSKLEKKEPMCLLFPSIPALHAGRGRPLHAADAGQVQQQRRLQGRAHPGLQGRRMGAQRVRHQSRKSKG